jgi:hypothetical protein
VASDSVPKQSSPFVVDGLDDEAKGRADGVDILAHDLFHNGCFSRIVQPTETMWSVQSWVGNEKRFTNSIRIRSSLSLSRAFRKIDSIFFSVSVIVRVPADVGGKVNPVVSACLGSVQLLPLSTSQEEVLCDCRS